MKVVFMEFSTIGAEDTLDEARKRLETVEALVVWGQENILGVICEEHLGRGGTCGNSCELDILVDPTPEKSLHWAPKFIITTDNGEPVLVSRGP